MGHGYHILYDIHLPISQQNENELNRSLESVFRIIQFIIYAVHIYFYTEGLRTESGMNSNGFEQPWNTR